MKKSILTIIGIIIVLVVLFYFWGKNEVKKNGGIELPAEVELVFGETILAEGKEITFTDVIEDSRCPKDATCVWEGQATVSLDIKVGENTNTVELNLFKEGNSVVSEGLALSLLSLEPQPETGETLEDSDYSINLKIEILSTQL